MEALVTNKNTELSDDLDTNLNNEQNLKEAFKPNGAIAFFILLIMLCLAVWYGIYFLMLQRN